MKIVFMVAEKPSLAKSLAELLSDGKCESIGRGPCSIHEYPGTFQDEHVLFRFTSVAGHMLRFIISVGHFSAHHPVSIFIRALTTGE